MIIHRAATPARITLGVTTVLTLTTLKVMIIMMMMMMMVMMMMMMMTMMMTTLKGNADKNLPHTSYPKVS